MFEIYADSKRFGFPVVIDNYFLPATLPEIFAAKKQAMVPLLAGWNSAEIPGMAFMQGPSNSPEEFAKKVKAAYPNDAEEVLKLYPGTTEKDVQYSSTALASDRFIAYSTWKWLDLQAQNSNKPVYRYLYSKMRPPLVDKGLTPGLAGGTTRAGNGGVTMPPPIGAPHACEIEYCMGNLPLVKDYAWTEDDYKTSETMLNYFANFIINGNPNGAKLPEWPAVKANDPQPDVMVINSESKAVKANDDARYKFLDKSYKNTK